MGYPEEDSCPLRVNCETGDPVTFTFQPGEGEQINPLYPSRSNLFGFGGFFLLERQPPDGNCCPRSEPRNPAAALNLSPNFRSLSTRPPCAYPIQNLTAGQAALKRTIFNTILIVGVIWLFILFNFALIFVFHLHFWSHQIARKRNLKRQVQNTPGQGFPSPIFPRY